MACIWWSRLACSAAFRMTSSSSFPFATKLQSGIPISLQWNSRMAYLPSLGGVLGSGAERDARHPLFPSWSYWDCAPSRLVGDKPGGSESDVRPYQMVIGSFLRSLGDRVERRPS